MNCVGSCPRKVSATWTSTIPLRPPCARRSWLRRGAQRRERRIEPEADITRMAADAATPAESAGNKDLLEQLYAALQAMPASERALMLLMLDGLAYREMAEVTGLTENHVGVALTRARKHLAILLKGVTDELG